MSILKSRKSHNSHNINNSSVTSFTSAQESQISQLSQVSQVRSLAENVSGHKGRKWHTVNCEMTLIYDLGGILKHDHGQRPIGQIVDFAGFLCLSLMV
jgi:hypothetical protein